MLRKIIFLLLITSCSKVHDEIPVINPKPAALNYSKTISLPPEANTLLVRY